MTHRSRCSQFLIIALIALGLHTPIKAEDYPVFRRFVTRVAEADRETVTLEAVK